MLTRIPILQMRKWRQGKAKEPPKDTQLVKSSWCQSPARTYGWAISSRAQGITWNRPF